MTTFSKGDQVTYLGNASDRYAPRYIPPIAQGAIGTVCYTSSYLTSRKDANGKYIPSVGYAVIFGSDENPPICKPVIDGRDIKELT